MVHLQRLELWTHWLRVSCSTNWAKGAYQLSGCPRYCHNGAGSRSCLLRNFLHLARLVHIAKNLAPAKLSFWSGRRDSNSRHLPWQGNALPLSHSRTYTILSFGAGDEIYELKGSYKLACISELCERPFALARGASYHWATPAYSIFLSFIRWCGWRDSNSHVVNTRS